MMISQNVLQPLRRLIRNPNGIIFVTGPTGSGKTTTLYAALNEINNPGSMTGMIWEGKTNSPRVMKSAICISQAFPSKKRSRLRLCRNSVLPRSKPKT